MLRCKKSPQLKPQSKEPVLQVSSHEVNGDRELTLALCYVLAGLRLTLVR